MLGVVNVKLEESEVRYVANSGVQVLTSISEVDVAAVASGIPVRRVRSHSGGSSYRGWFWSSTTSRHIVTVVDVKPAKFVRLPDVAAVLKWTEVLCASRGWSYEVWTGAEQVRLERKPKPRPLR